MKHPRAANFIWKLDNGRYVYWFHNHGGQGFDDRNPAWLCGATEYPARTVSGSRSGSRCRCCMTTTR